MRTCVCPGLLDAPGMSFPKLLEIALVGTLRQEPPASPVAHQELSAETRMLRGASYEGLRRLAGRPLERTDSLIPPPAPAEVLTEVPPAAAVRLLELLGTAERRAEPRERHRAGVVPGVDHLGHPAGRRATLAAADLHVVHERPVGVE